MGLATHFNYYLDSFFVGQTSMATNYFNPHHQSTMTSTRTLAHQHFFCKNILHTILKLPPFYVIESNPFNNNLLCNNQTLSPPPPPPPNYIIHLPNLDDNNDTHNIQNKNDTNPLYLFICTYSATQQSNFMIC